MKSNFVLACLFVLGCGGSLSPAQQARVDKFECRVEALKPYVGEVMDAAQLVRDLYAGKASLSNALGSLDLTESDAKDLFAAFAECDAPKEETN